MRDPFALNPDQFSRTLRSLLELRNNQPLLYARPEEVVDLMRQHQIALVFGNYGDQQVRLLKQAGIDVGYVMPREGALAWLDCWAILRGTQDRKLAEAWINHMLTPNVAAHLTHTQGLSSTLHEADTGSTRGAEKYIWLQPVEDNAKRVHYWERWLAGAHYAR